MNCAIILAAGIGSRFDDNNIKFLSILAGKRVLDHTLQAFENNELINKIFLVINPQHKKLIKDSIDIKKYKKIAHIIEGGSCRQESVFNSIKHISRNVKETKTENINVCIHDSVRPLVDSEIITNSIEKLRFYNAVDCAIPVVDTLVSVDSYKNIISIPERKNFMSGQTPQSFKLNILLDCYEKVIDQGVGLDKFTDDCGIFKMARPDDTIHVISGSWYNIKITYPQDITIADKLLQLKNKTTISSHITHNHSLKEKVVVIFGGNSGIGLEIKKECEKNQAKVFCYSRSLTNTDISNIQSVKESLDMAFNHLSKIDFIINASGILYKKTLKESTEQEIDEQIKTNLLGCINISKLAPDYIKTNGGLIFFTSSSYTMGRKNYCVYSATKAAIVNLTQGLAEELYEKKIRVNAICPRRTKTPMRFKNFGEEKDLLDPKEVAIATIETMISERTGDIIKI